MTEHEKIELVYFRCESSTKKEFDKIAKERGFTPGSLLRAFMRKSIAAHHKDKDIEFDNFSEE